MKPHLTVFLGACLLLGASVTASLRAQPPAPAVPASTAPLTEAEELEQLVAPIALYPDALVALILPAAAESADVVLAARFLEGGGKPEGAQTQAWDDSVKSLVHYPEVVKWMDQNLAWTRQIGEAYMENPAEVMAAIQRARARAQANGVLVSTPQQNVVVEGGYIMIVPAQPEVIYVPRYDPEIIYVDRPFYYRPDPWLTFGVGFGVGWWLNYDCDWRRRVIVIDRRHRDHWRDRHHWYHDRFVGPAHHDHRVWQPWAPRPDRLRHMRHVHAAGRPPRPIVRPAPIAGAPHFDHPRHRPGDRFGHDRNRPSREYHAGARVAAPTDRGAVPAGNVSPRSPRKPGEQSPLSNNTGIRRFQPSANGAPEAHRGQPFERGRPSIGERGNISVATAAPRVAPSASASSAVPPSIRQSRTQDRPRPSSQGGLREMTQRRDSSPPRSTPAPASPPQAPRVAPVPPPQPAASTVARMERTDRPARVERAPGPSGVSGGDRPVRVEHSRGRGGDQPER